MVLLVGSENVKYTSSLHDSFIFIIIMIVIFKSPEHKQTLVPAKRVYYLWPCEQYSRST